MSRARGQSIIQIKMNHAHKLVDWSPGREESNGEKILEIHFLGQENDRGTSASKYGANRTFRLEIMRYIGLYKACYLPSASRPPLTSPQNRVKKNEPDIRIGSEST